MRAATIRRYGPPEVVRIEEMPRPVPRAHEVLIRVIASPVTAGDARMRGLDLPAGFGLVARPMLGLRAPRRPVFGSEFAGEVVTGAGPFAAGTRVFGITGLRGGAHAEYLAVPADGKVLPIPQGLSDIEAAAFFFGGLTAADFLIDKAALAPGQRLLVNGATGAVGSAAVQIARHTGAWVTALCRAENADLARELGADETADYREALPRGPFDAILDVAGTLPFPAARPLLAPGGTLLPVTAGLGQTLGAALRPRRGPHRIAGGVIAETRAAMERLVALYRAGAYRPAIGATFPLSQIAKAHALASARHKRGNAVVLMAAE